MSELVKNSYQNLDSEFRHRYRGRFTAIVGELVVYEELVKRRYRPSIKSGQSKFDFLVNGKRVVVKSCNTAYVWITRAHNPMFPGCAEIMPSQFDVLIYVELNNAMDVIDYFIFTRREALTLPYTHQERTGYAKRYQLSESRTLNNPFSKERFSITQQEVDRLNAILFDSNNAWDKI
jgi:hypothetical protein